VRRFLESQNGINRFATKGTRTIPRLTNSSPKYRKHRASDRAIVTLNGKDHYLGPHGTKASKAEYDR